MTIRKGHGLNEGEPLPDTPCHVWCVDEAGEYRLPYLCVWRNGAWYGLGKSNPLTIRVIGWRISMPKPSKKSSGQKAGRWV
jgi:hypothetical protein